MSSEDKINVFIAKTGRDHHLRACLHYLDSAADEGRDVVVYVIDERPCSLEIGTFRNLRVEYLLESTSPGLPFRKGFLLNRGISRARTDYSWLAIVDVDMVYRSGCFGILEGYMRCDHYTISTGQKLNETDSIWVLERLPEFRDIGRCAHEDFSSCPSQVSMSRRVYALFVDVFKSPLFEGDYVGWGAEDSELSYKSRLLENAGLLTKVELSDAWFHLYHPLTYDEALYQSNLRQFEAAAQRADLAVREYLRRSEATSVRASNDVAHERTR
jgi:hypothetical protein